MSGRDERQAGWHRRETKHFIPVPAEKIVWDRDFSIFFLSRKRKAQKGEFP
jgi:hypothetical protein